jgi:hypothetical protein
MTVRVLTASLPDKIEYATVEAFRTGCYSKGDSVEYRILHVHSHPASGRDCCRLDASTSTERAVVDVYFAPCISADPHSTCNTNV